MLPHDLHVTIGVIQGVSGRDNPGLQTQRRLQCRRRHRRVAPDSILHKRLCVRGVCIRGRALFLGRGPMCCWPPPSCAAVRFRNGACGRRWSNRARARRVPSAHAVPAGHATPARSPAQSLGFSPPPMNERPAPSSYPDGDAAVVVEHGRGQEDVADGGALRPEAAGGAGGDDEVGVKRLHREVRRQRRGHGADVVDAVHEALAVDDDVDGHLAPRARVRRAGRGAGDGGRRVLLQAQVRQEGRRLGLHRCGVEGRRACGGREIIQAATRNPQAGRQGDAAAGFPSCPGMQTPASLVYPCMASSSGLPSASTIQPICLGLPQILPPPPPRCWPTGPIPPLSPSSPPPKKP